MKRLESFEEYGVTDALFNEDTLSETGKLFHALIFMG